MSSSRGRKGGKGRQKVNMTKIENQTSLQVTFSKRRAGVFKKASEISTLCGAETAVIVFSPSNKAHSFGHPNVDTICNRFLNQDHNVDPLTKKNDAEKLGQPHHKANVAQQAAELNQIEQKLAREVKRASEIEQLRKGAQWGPPDISKLDYRQLSQLKGALLRLKHELHARVQNATTKSGNNNNIVTIPYSSTATTSGVDCNEFSFC